MSTIARVFSRSGLRTTRHVAPRLPPITSRVLGRRSYASGHGEVKKMGDTPWILLALGITVPGVYLLWPPPRSHGGHGAHDAHDAHGEEHKEDKGHEEPSNDSESNDTQSTEEKKSDDDSSDSVNDSSPTPKGPDNGSGEHDKSTESQAKKLTDKPASKRVDPTEK